MKLLIVLLSLGLIAAQNPATYNPVTYSTAPSGTCYDHYQCNSNEYCFSCSKCLSMYRPEFCGSCASTGAPGNCGPASNCYVDNDSINGYCPSGGNYPTPRPYYPTPRPPTRRPTPMPTSYTNYNCAAAYSCDYCTSTNGCSWNANANQGRGMCVSSTECDYNQAPRYSSSYSTSSSSTVSVCKTTRDQCYYDSNIVVSNPDSGNGCTTHDQCGYEQYCFSCQQCLNSGQYQNCGTCSYNSAGRCGPVNQCYIDDDSITGTCPGGGSGGNPRGCTNHNQCSSSDYCALCQPCIEVVGYYNCPGCENGAVGTCLNDYYCYPKISVDYRC